MPRLLLSDEERHAWLRCEAPGCVHLRGKKYEKGKFVGFHSHCCIDCRIGLSDTHKDIPTTAWPTMEEGELVAQAEEVLALLSRVPRSMARPRLSRIIRARQRAPTRSFSDEVSCSRTLWREQAAAQVFAFPARYALGVAMSMSWVLCMHPERHRVHVRSICLDEKARRPARLRIVRRTSGSSPSGGH